MNWQDFFKGKKVTQMGLGLLGRGIGDAEFLSKYSAEIIVTDLKKRADLEISLGKLSGRPNITFVLGGHRLEDFGGRDFILKAAGVPLNSPYIAEARKNGISIEMDAALFAKLVPKGVKIIGVTGTRGKSTTAALIYEMLRRTGHRVFMGGNIVPSATLPLLEKVRDGDFVVLELDSWQLQGFGEAKISPHIAVFTTFMEDHMNYYGSTDSINSLQANSPQVGSTSLTTNTAMERYFEDKANIFKYQTKNDFLIVGEDISGLVKGKTAGKLVIAHRRKVIDAPLGEFTGDHNKLNASCALAVAKIFGVTGNMTRQVLKVFKSLPGRLQSVKFYRQVTIFNDNNSTTPDATIAGLRTISRDKNVVLIMGGSDKGLDMSVLIEEIPKYCKAVVLLPGTGSSKLKVESLKLQVEMVQNLEEAVEKAVSLAKSGDIILFSPAFASFGPPPGGFKNEYDRGDKFMEIVRKLG